MIDSHSPTTHRRAEQPFNRLKVILGALLIQLSLGAIYAWSVFTQPLVAAGWSKSETQIIFSVGLAAFAIVMVVAGRLMPRFGPHNLAMVGGALLGLGYIAAGLLGATDFWTLVVCVGVIGGGGIGLAYVVPIAVGMRWFPDKKGLITGLAVAGFGFGAMLWVKMAGQWGNLIGLLGLDVTFVIYGLSFLVLVLIGSIWMVFPPEGWTPEGFSETSGQAAGQAADVEEIDSRRMLRTPQFYMIFTTFLFSASAGLMSIGLMKLYPSQALMAGGMSQTEALAVAGTAMAVYFSLANGLGRIGWGMISDKTGRKAALAVMIALQGATMLVFPYMAGTTALLYLGAALIGFNFGGNFALFPTITADIFGARNVGQNYGLVFIAYGFGGIFGPILGGRLGDMGDFPLAFTIVGVACLMAAGLIAAVKQPQPQAHKTLTLKKHKARRLLAHTLPPRKIAH